MRKELQFYYEVMKRRYRKGTSHVLRKKVKYISRTLFYYPYSMELANFIMQHSYLSKTMDQYPMITEKLHKPYMRFSFTAKEKLEVIFSSYAYLDRYFRNEVLQELYAKGKIKVADIQGKEDCKLSAYLKLYPDFDKEGEFNLLLYQGEILLSTLTFAVWKHHMFIGGLQGLGRIYKDPEILKKVTKNFYGLFPKRILMEVFYHLFPESKIAVGNANHIYLAQRYRYKKERKVKADYDEFWESLGGIQREDGLWELAETIARKPIEEIPSKKRSQYRSRYQILDAIQESVTNFLINTK